MDRGRQKRLNSCAGTLPCWRASPCGCSALDRSAIDIRFRRADQEGAQGDRRVRTDAPPRDYRVFAGVIDLDHWPAWGRLLFKALGGHAGDNRQWPDIDAWAERIAQELRAQTESARQVDGSLAGTTWSIARSNHERNVPRTGAGTLFDARHASSRCLLTAGELSLTSTFLIDSSNVRVPGFVVRLSVSAATQ